MNNPYFGRRIDVVIFGATGCAGRYTVIEAVQVLKYCSWGVAGRNKSKLKALLEDVGMQTRKNLSRIPIIVANVKERWSLVRMARRCKVLVNCCGPYETLGEPVIKACLFAKTHYVDLCIESRFMDLMQFRYDEEARRKKVYIVSACGLQSIPMEIGVNFMKKHFIGTVNHIEAYVEFWTEDPLGLEGLGTNKNWTSFVLGNSNRKRLRRRVMPKIPPPAPRRGILFQSNVVDGFCVPSPTVDEDIADRTQLYFYEEKQRRPIKFSSYFAFPSLFVAAALLIWYFVIALLSQSECTRKLLLKWPRVFSLGIVSQGEQNERNMEGTMFRITFRAVGWERRTRDPRFVFTEKPLKTMTGQSKLKALLEDVGMQTRKNLSRIPIIVANVKERWSLVRMARRCKVLVNCCGPYETLGEPVIKACLFAKTHYVDLCIESRFMDLMQFRYDEEARRKKVYIVSACGLQSIPMEIGVNFMKKHFIGTVNHIEAYVEFWTEDPLGLEGLGTNKNWTSFVLGNSNRKRLRRRVMPKIPPPAPRRGILFQSNVVDGFCVPSPTVDEDIADRTQLYFYEEKQRRPIKFSSYFAFPSLFVAAALLIWYFVIALLSQSECTRKLLLKWPRVFSLGIVSQGEQNERNMEGTMFRITFRAVGWERRTRDPRFVFTEKPLKTMTGQVSGQCPLYGVACVCLLVSATTVLNDRFKLPQE